MLSYDIVIPLTLTRSLDGVPSMAHDEILDRLADAPAHQRHGHGRPGTHRGMHRVTVRGRWVLYRVDHTRRSVVLIGFGDRSAAECSEQESSWENEGGYMTH